MATRREIYKCQICGNIVEVLHGSDGELVCCQEPMVLLKENTVDASKEKQGNLSNVKWFRGIFE